MANEVWDQQKDENDLWFSRFEIYRLMGPGRSLLGLYMICKAEDPNLTGMQPGVNWREKSAKYHWYQRARAWDEQERDKFRVEAQQLAEDKRLTRLQMIGELKNKTFSALLTAGIDELDRNQARSLFPQLRLLMISLLASERVEYGVGESEINPNELTGEEAAAIASMKANIERVWGVKEEEMQYESGAGE